MQVFQVLYCWQTKTSTCWRDVSRHEEGSNLKVRETGPRGIEVVKHHVLSWVLLVPYFAIQNYSVPVPDARHAHLREQSNDFDLRAIRKDCFHRLE